jgi:serine/threonine protein phosphatase PrpC
MFLNKVVIFSLLIFVANGAEIKYAVASACGSKPVMQDRYRVNIGPKHLFLGMFDGHGYEGHNVAETVSRNIYRKYR